MTNQFVTIMALMVLLLVGCQKPQPMMQPMAEQRTISSEVQLVFEHWLEPGWTAEFNSDGTVKVPWHPQRVNLEFYGWITGMKGK